MSQKMGELAAQQPGFLGMESARNEGGLGVTVSYWDSLDAIRKWKANMEHLTAQEAGKTVWYETYCTRIAKVERDYSIGLELKPE